VQVVGDKRHFAAKLIEWVGHSYPPGSESSGSGIASSPYVIR
jgi:hypothetical protein